MGFGGHPTKAEREAWLKSQREPTPGPWLIQPGPMGNIRGSTRSGAAASVYAREEGWGLVIDGKSQGGNAVIAPNCLRMADARLIAAAPEMLVMCERLLDVVKGEERAQLEAVIAKARGLT